MFQSFFYTIKLTFKEGSFFIYKFKSLIYMISSSSSSSTKKEDSYHFVTQNTYILFIYFVQIVLSAQQNHKNIYLFLVK